MRDSQDNETSQQASILHEFFSIVNISNAEEAKRFLEPCNWNLEQAVTLYYVNRDEVDRAPSAAGQIPTVPHSTQPTPPFDFLETQSSSIFPSWLIQQIKALGLKILSFSTSIISLMRLFCTSISSAAGSFAPTRFNTYFHEQFGSTGPTFTDLKFLQAYQKAKQSRKVLLVYIHHPQASHATDIVTHVFQNETFMNMLTEYGCVLWGCKADQFEAAYLIRQQLLSCLHFPHLSFIVIPPETVQPSNLSRPIDDAMTWLVVGSLEGEVSNADEALRLLTCSIEMTSNFQRSQSRRTQQVSESRRIREEQDLAYMKTLQKDAELKAEREAKEKQFQEEQKKLQVQAQQELERKTHKFEECRQSAKDFISTYMKFLSEQSTVHEVIFRIRLSDGIYFDHLFDITKFRLRDVFHWIRLIAFLNNRKAKEADSLQVISENLCASLNLEMTSEQFTSVIGSPVDQIIQAVIPDEFCLVPSMEPSKVYTIQSPECQDYLETLGFSSQTLFFFETNFLEL